MERLSDFRKLRRFANRLGVRVQFMSEKTFDSQYAGVQAFYDPYNSRICMNRKLDEKNAAFRLYALAHEIGHVVDHCTDDDAVAEYRLHYDLASLYSDHGLEIPSRSREVFQVREDMAYAIGESVLRELGIVIDDETKGQFQC